jgi:hypothetical protein
MMISRIKADPGQRADNGNRSTLQVALQCASAGLSVVPLHGKRMGGICTCDAAADCKTPGMHPRTGDGVRGATTDRQRVTRYWTKWPRAKIGIATGGDVRAALQCVTNFAEKHGLAVVLVSHLNKSRGANAITRIMGSTDWVAVPRAVCLVAEEFETDRRLFLPVKNNLAPDRIGYAFRIEDRVVPEGISTSAVVWDPEPVMTTADEALAATAKKTGSSAAIDFLRQALSDGPVDQADIVQLGKDAGFSEKSLRNAREKLGAKSRKEGFGADGKWVWESTAMTRTLIADNDATNRPPAAGIYDDDAEPEPEGL